MSDLQHVTFQMNMFPYCTCFFLQNTDLFVCLCVCIDSKVIRSNELKSNTQFYVSFSSTSYSSFDIISLSISWQESVWHDPCTLKVFLLWFCFGFLWRLCVCSSVLLVTVAVPRVSLLHCRNAGQDLYTTIPNHKSTVVPFTTQDN